MKEYSVAMFDYARADLEIAKENKGRYPNLAAFHAQQCAEKAVKALLYEYSEVRNYDTLGRSIGHDSLMASLGVLRQTMKRISSGSSLRKQLRATMRSTERHRNKGWELVWLISYAFLSTLDDAFDLFDVEAAPLDPTIDLWAASLKENIALETFGDKEWLQELDRVSDRTDLIMSMLVSSVGLPEAQSLISAQGKTPAEVVWDLGKASEIARRKGQEKMAQALTLGQERIGNVVDTTVFVDWIKLVLRWGPLLDAHAIRGRYPSISDMKTYRQNGRAVSVLVDKSGQILELTRSLAKTPPF